MRFLLVTDPGIEPIVAEELRERLGPAEIRIEPYGCPGQVRVEVASSDELFQLSTVHHLIEIRAETEARTLEDVRAAVAQVELDELKDAGSFRVSSDHRGDHRFERVELQGAAGAVLQGRYGTKVDLERFEVNVRVDLYDQRLMVGIQRTRDSLGKRIERGKPLRSSLKPTIAAAMLRLAGAHRGAGRLIDPMCGAATIPVEAARINPALELFASDWDAQTVATAEKTLENHGLEIAVELLDARSLGRKHPGRFDYIVTDPPYGMRQAKRARLTTLYGSLLASFETALGPSGRIVIIVVKYRVLLAALERTGLRVAQQRVIESGRISPRIFVLERGV